MQEKLSERKETWKTIIIFLTIVTIISSLFHYAIVNLYPSRIYIGAIMWCPPIAAIITLKLKGRSIASLNWNWGNWKYIRLSYFVPALYALIAYILIWLFELGGLPNEKIVLEEKLQLISEREREIILMKDIYGYKFREIGKVKDMKLSTVKSIYYKGLKEMG